jgi:hypothetical protein
MRFGARRLSINAAPGAMVSTEGFIARFGEKSVAG